MIKHGKMYVEASKEVEKNKLYTKEEAVKLLKSLKTKKFDETVEAVVKLNIDTKKSEMNVRNSLVLPHGSGKTKRVLVITKDIETAKKAGADFVGAEDMIEKIQKENWMDFDIIVASPDMMIALGKIGKILGPKGLMPNPKLGTVTNNIELAVKNIKKGQIEYRNDTFGNVHTIIGKVSFSEKDLVENLSALVSTISKNKPNGVKGTFITGVSICSTMSPGIKVDKNSFDI